MSKTELMAESENTNEEKPKAVATKEATEVVKAEVVKAEVVTAEVSSSLKETKEVEEAMTVAVQENGLAALGDLSFEEINTPKQYLKLSEMLVKSTLVGFKKPEDAVVALKTGNELGLPLMQSLTNIHVIQGKPSLGIHLQKALCMGKGMVFTIVRNAETKYEFAIIKEDGKPETVGYGFLDEQPEGTKKKAIDTVTVVKGYRERIMPSGKVIEDIQTAEYGMLDATTAQLTTKDNWKQHWKRMLEARAFGILIKNLAPDLLAGIPSPDELSNKFTINESGETIKTIDV